jgi:hypothetical protein
MSSKETAEAILIVIKRIGKWIAATILAILLFYLALYAYNKVEEYYQNRPKIVESLKGIGLGEKYSDFMFRNAGFILDVDRNKRNTDITYYENKEKSLTVAIVDGKVVRILYACNDKSEFISINGINCRSSGDDVFKKFDREILVQCLKDKSNSSHVSYRVYDAINYGVRYHVVSNEVIAIDVNNPNEFKKTDGYLYKNWSSCE